MPEVTGLLVGRANGQDIDLLPAMATRHGLIAGATGTGKTVTLQTMAEGLSRLGTSVFLADVKGDLAGLSAAGGGNDRIEQRAEQLHISPLAYEAYPTDFWDVFGVSGHPLRTTVSDFGPLLLARLLDLNQTQSDVLAVIFKIADDAGLLLLDLKDLHAMLQEVGTNGAAYRDTYGAIATTTLGTIQRALLALEQQGATTFFGEPALDIQDFMRTAPDGRGMVNILAANKLMEQPKAYATMLLWLLSELFESLPEVGDLPQPKLVFFFDEAHLLFADISPALLTKVEQVVRLVRSKGVGIFFVTQNPLDIPESVLGQLSNRVQHALRAFTPLDQKAVKAAAQTFRSNAGIDVTTAITQLEVGEALVSFLNAKGEPSPVERAFIVPPQSHVGQIDDASRQAIIQGSPLSNKYGQTIDRESAYERLRDRAQSRLSDVQVPDSQVTLDSPERSSTSTRTASAARRPVRSETSRILEAAATSTVRAIGSQAGRSLIRGLMGSLFGGTTSRRR